MEVLLFVNTPDYDTVATGAEVAEETFAGEMDETNGVDEATDLAAADVTLAAILVEYFLLSPGHMCRLESV